ncbi:serine/threonine-protein phosphatase 1 regulatory subunit 10-like [Mya arenaria]|uniref:serine/threonine-protein phosphatase 1 regulatory subunit 10-like n=1 Tax=Mya arenaria TaxID=6604 RepID=UPI0022E62CCC|nr:serine/threonine-protein phosphatase 1 regulatory subunit 10-like [Mya arenaria]
MEVEVLVYTKDGFKRVKKRLNKVPEADEKEEANGRGSGDSEEEKEIERAEEQSEDDNKMVVDPQEVLKSLDELLSPTGAMKGPEEVVKIAGMMKEASKLVNKCVFINILKVETSKDNLEKLISGGGWETLNEWLQQAKEDENNPFIIELLKVYRQLPVTVDLLKTNKAAKTIKHLCKTEHADIQTVAKAIFEEWMKLVQPASSEKPKKKRDKDRETDKEKDREREKDKSSSSSSSKSKDSKSSKDSKHRSESGHRESRDSKDGKDEKNRDRKDRDRKDRDKDKEREKDGAKERSKKIEEENMDSSSNDSVQGGDEVTVRKGSGLKLHIKLNGEKTEGKDGEIKKRPATVKRPPSKFRSTGLVDEETTPPPAKLPKNADLSKPIPKRTGSDIKSDLPSKRSRLQMPPPLTVPSTTSTTTASNSPTSPGEMHGKIKINPARSKSNYEIHESTGFMESLDTKSAVRPVKKKRRSSGATPPTSSSGKAPNAPPSPVSPNTAIAKSLPSVPSFYKDTQQEAEPSPEEEKKEESIEDSPSPTGQVTEKAEKAIEGENNDGNGEKERSASPTESQKGLLTTGATKVKKNKKKVSWKPEHEIKEVFLFELDEDERVNVNRAKDFNSAKKAEMIQDRRAVESVRRMANDHMIEQITWYRAPVVLGRKELEYGKESKERSVQRQREAGVLQALFFSRNMLPDTPKEPEMEQPEEHEEPKVIPLEDVSGGEQLLYNYETNPKPVVGSKKSSNSSQPQKQAPPLLPNPEGQGGPGMPPDMPPNSSAGFMPPNMALPSMGPSMPGGQPGGPMGPMGPGPIQDNQQAMQGGIPGGPPPPNGPGGFNVPANLNLPPDLSAILSQIQSQPSGPGTDPVMAQVQQILNNIMCGGSEQSYEQLQQIQQIMSQQMGIPPEMLMQMLPPGMPPPMGMPPPGPMGMRGPPPMMGNGPPGFMGPRQMGPGPPNRFGPGPQGSWGGPNMGGGNFGNPNQGPGNFRMRGSWQPGLRGGKRGGGPNPNRRDDRYRKKACVHFQKNGYCRMGDDCDFLHPGVHKQPNNDSIDT